jgi:hypothetical protein
MSFINVSVIKRIKQDEFKTFADLVYDNMNGKTVYAFFQVAVTAMSETAVIFQQALIKSKGRASEAMDAKKVAHVALINALLRIAKLMDAEWQTDAEDKLKTDAGFTLCKTPERLNVTYVNPPTNLTAYNDPRRGVIVVEFIKAENAVTTAFEVQKDGGAWENDLFCETEKMELTFPFGIKLLIRAKTIGPKQLVSDYTAPVDVMVS